MKYLIKSNKIKGGNADNMTLEDISRKHKIFYDDLLVEYELGKIVEREHTDDPEGIEEIALDHIFDNSHYYTEGKEKGIFEELDKVNIEDIRKKIEKGEIQKAKYIKRTKGKSGKWIYEYPKQETEKKEVPDIKETLRNLSNLNKKMNSLADKIMGHKIENRSWVDIVNDPGKHKDSSEKTELMSAYKQYKEQEENYKKHMLGKKYMTVKKEINPLNKYKDKNELRGKEGQMFYDEWKEIKDKKEKASNSGNQEEFEKYNDLEKQYSQRYKEFKYFSSVEKSVELEEFEKAKQDPELKKMMEHVMGMFKRGELKDSHENVVTDKGQALAIAYSKYRDGKVSKSELTKMGQTPVEWDHKYRLMGKVRWNGLKIGIENKKGSVRKGTDPDGKPWEIKMNYPYGRILGTMGTDRNHIDVYLGPNRKSDKVFVVHQNNPWTGKYDEDKVMIGFNDGESAKSAYQSQYDRPDFFGSMDEMTVDELKDTMKACRGRMLQKQSYMQKSFSEKDMIKINDFLRETEGKIEDEELHEFAEKNGYNVHRVEEYIYMLAQSYLDNMENNNE